MLLGPAWYSSDRIRQFYAPRSSREFGATARGTPVSSLSHIDIHGSVEAAGLGGECGVGGSSHPKGIHKAALCLLLQG